MAQRGLQKPVAILDNQEIQQDFRKLLNGSARIPEHSVFNPVYSTIPINQPQHSTVIPNFTGNQQQISELAAKLVAKLSTLDLTAKVLTPVPER